MCAKAFIWDLDGTLLDSYGTIVDGLFDTCREFGIEADKSAIHRYVIASSVSSFIQVIAEKTGAECGEIKARYSALCDKDGEITAITHAREALSALAGNGSRNYVFTHRGSSTEAVLRRLGLYGFFDEIITGQSGFPRKPAPDALLYLIKKYALSPSDTYYVGDRTIDMDCAKNAGISGILYKPEDSLCEPNGSEKHIVSDLIQIERIQLR